VYAGLTPVKMATSCQHGNCLLAHIRLTSGADDAQVKSAVIQLHAVRSSFRSGELLANIVEAVDTDTISRLHTQSVQTSNKTFHVAPKTGIGQKPGGIRCIDQELGVVSTTCMAW
jgi:hypothetical protein